MEMLGVCERWVNCLGECNGCCGLRHPRWQGNRDLFYHNVRRAFSQGQCHLDRCPLLHIDEEDGWEAALVRVVGPEDAAWDWTSDRWCPDILADLLESSTRVDSQVVLDGILQLVSDDHELVAYFEQIRDRVHQMRNP